MPFCHKNKLLFIHIPKTAGKSISLAIFGKAWKPSLGQRNIFNRAAKLFQIFSASKVSKLLLHGTVDYSFASQHMTLLELRSLGFLDNKYFKDYVSFSVVRNPYTRIRSTINHLFQKIIKPKLGKSSITSEEDLIKAIEIWQDSNPSDHNQRALKKSNVDFLLNKYGEISVDHILKFENLNYEWGKFVKNQKLHCSFKLKHITNKSTNLIFPPFEKESARLVSELYKEDFELLNYDKDYRFL